MILVCGMRAVVPLPPTLLHTPPPTLLPCRWHDAEKEGLGHFLYRWTVSTPEGLQVHSHAVPNAVTQGEWVLDVHVNCTPPPEAP